MSTPLRVVLETAPKRVFASALDWPGWSRSAKADEAALEALVSYAPRYARVAKRAKVAFSPPKTVAGVEIVERLGGGSGTEFGVPGTPASAESADLAAAELTRLVSLLEAAWATFDAAARKAEAVHLRLGPRGGGRQVPKIIEHVREAEGAYIHQLGAKVPGARAPMASLRRAFIEALNLRAANQPLPEPNNVRRPWVPRYAIRRSAWHALDHAWEIEDRST